MMVYNTSQACVRRHERYLQDMLQAEATLTWPASDAEVFARKLREAMFAAQKHPEYTHFHRLRDLYRIRPMNGWVEAQWLGPPAAVKASKPTLMRIEEAINAQGVVGACIKFAPKGNEINFPNAVLTEDEKLAVYAWGMGEVPQWQLISHDNEGVTMTRKPVDQVFLWKPPEKEDDSG